MDEWSWSSENAESALSARMSYKMKVGELCREGGSTERSHRRDHHPQPLSLPEKKMQLLPLALLALSTCNPVAAQSGSPPIVDLGYAKYQGTFNATTNQTEFLSIRYAAPPIGEMICLPFTGERSSDRLVRQTAVPGARSSPE